MAIRTIGEALVDQCQSMQRDIQGLRERLVLSQQPLDAPQWCSCMFKKLLGMLESCVCLLRRVEERHSSLMLRDGGGRDDNNVTTSTTPFVLDYCMARNLDDNDVSVTMMRHQSAYMADAKPLYLVLDFVVMCLQAYLHLLRRFETESHWRQHLDEAVLQRLLRVWVPEIAGVRHAQQDRLFCMAYEPVVHVNVNLGSGADACAVGILRRNMTGIVSDGFREMASVLQRSFEDAKRAGSYSSNVSMTRLEKFYEAAMQRLKNPVSAADVADHVMLGVRVIDANRVCGGAAAAAAASRIAIVPAMYLLIKDTPLLEMSSNRVIHISENVASAGNVCRAFETLARGLLTGSLTYQQAMTTFTFAFIDLLPVRCIIVLHYS